MGISTVSTSRTVSAIRRQVDIPVVSPPTTDLESVVATGTLSVATASTVEVLPSESSINSSFNSDAQTYGNCASQTSDLDLSATPTNASPHLVIKTKDRVPILTSSSAPISFSTFNAAPSNVVSSPLLSDNSIVEPIESVFSTLGAASTTSLAFLSTTQSLNRPVVTATILKVIPHPQALDSPSQIAVETSAASPTAAPAVPLDVPNIPAQNIPTTTSARESTFITSLTIPKSAAIPSTSFYQPISSSIIATASITLVAGVTQSDAVSTPSLSVPYPGSTNSTRNGQNSTSSAVSKTQKAIAIAATMTVLFVIGAMVGLVYVIRRRRLRRRTETREGGRGHWANRQMSPYNHGSVAQHSFRPISELEVERSRFSFGSL